MWTYLVLYLVNWEWMNDPCRENYILAYMVTSLINMKVELIPWCETWYFYLYGCKFGIMKVVKWPLTRKWDFGLDPNKLFCINKLSWISYFEKSDLNKPFCINKLFWISCVGKRDLNKLFCIIKLFWICCFEKRDPNKLFCINKLFWISYFEKRDPNKSFCINKLFWISCFEKRDPNQPFCINKLFWK